MEWLDITLEKIIEKMPVVSKRTGIKIPYTTLDGLYTDQFSIQPSWWTNGFWSGLLLNLYSLTEDEQYLKQAEQAIERLDIVLSDSESIHHDVGFMWDLSSGKHYRMTQDPRNRNRVLTAAKYLASRFDIEGGYIVAWNSVEKESWSIIDTMMNLPLLFFATQETGYKRYAQIAKAHADKTLENFIRPDGSVEHIVIYDKETGEKADTLGGQGYDKGSSWSRGQSWAIYGFTEAFRYTNDCRYLDAAKRVAHYFISCVQQTGFIPLLDFRAPKTPVYYDTTAGAIAASGLISLSQCVPEYEQKLYLDNAKQILKALCESEFDDAIEHDNLLKNGSEAYDPKRHKALKHISIIYGDYYFVEALIKLKR